MSEPSSRSLRNGIVLSFFSAVLYAASFPPADLAVLGWVALVPFYAGLAQTPPRWGFFVGWIWAFVVGCGTAYFVPEMLETYFDLSPTRAFVMFVALVLSPGLWYALFGVWLSLRRSWGPVGPFEIAGVWGAAEWARSSVGIANPWALSGYSQTTLLPALQGVSLVGVVGLGMLLALVNATLAVPFLRQRPASWSRSAAAAAIVVILWFSYGFMEVARDRVRESSIRIGLVQTSLPRSLRTDRRADEFVLSRHLELSRFAARAGADLIVWPEYAIERPLAVGSRARQRLADFTRTSGVGLLLGTIGEREERPTNTALLFESGELRGRYDKVLLMPLGEARPGASLLNRTGPWLVPGTSRDPILSRLGRIGVLACNEVMSAAAVRATTQNGAELLINLANDDWFGPHGVLPQLRIASTRAVENRRYLARATHSGITAVISPIGRVLHEAAQREAGVLVGEVQMSSEQSLYSNWGDGPVLALALAAMMRSVFAWRRFRSMPV